MYDAVYPASQTPQITVTTKDANKVFQLVRYNLRRAALINHSYFASTPLEATYWPTGSHGLYGEVSTEVWWTLR